MCFQIEKRIGAIIFGRDKAKKFRTRIKTKTKRLCTGDLKVKRRSLEK